MVLASLPPDPSSSTSSPSRGSSRRPSPSVILSQWHSFFSDPLLSPHALKQVALQGQVAQRGLRSLHWRYYFSLLPSPAPLSDSIPSPTWTSYSLPLSHARAEYTSLRTTFLRSPDDKWVSDYLSSPSPDSPKPPALPPKAPKTSAKVQVDANNPLAIDDGNPWQGWFEDLELRRLIRQDVARTFPEIAYFHSPATQDRMTDLLFIFVKSISSDIGYRQGMHELLALVLWIVDLDALASSCPPDPPIHSLEGLAHLVLAEEYIEHDAWSLFTALMKSCKTFYDSTPSVSIPSAKSSSTSTSLALVQPIVATSLRIHDSLLATIDPDLHAKLNRLGVEPQLYAIRWLRLLFTREFPVEQALVVWDGVFAEDPSLRLTEFICLAMLLRIRDAILLTDYSGVLSLLLRYPAPIASPTSYRVNSLLSQALLLRDSLSLSTAQSILQSNEELGFVAGDLDLLRIEDEHGTAATGQRPRPPSSAIAARGLLGEGALGDLAKGVYGRAEALGWTGALQGGLATINDLVNRGITVQSTTSARDPLSQIPSKAPWEIQPRPLPPPPPIIPTPTSQEKDSMQKLSRAIELCVSVIESEIASPPSTDGDGRTSQALNVLKHVRDILSGSLSEEFDERTLEKLRPAPTIIPAIGDRAPKPSVPASTTSTSNASAVSTAPTSPSITSSPDPEPRPAVSHSIVTSSTQPSAPSAASPTLPPPSPPPKPYQTHTSKTLGVGPNARSGPLPLTGFSTRSTTNGQVRGDGAGTRKVTGIDPLGVVGMS